jgi:hypothetical protein
LSTTTDRQYQNTAAVNVGRHVRLRKKVKIVAMVDVSGRREELLQGLVDRTRSGLQSVLRPSTSRTKLFNGLSSRIESALAKRSNSADLLQSPPPEQQPQNRYLALIFSFVLYV